MLSHASRSRLHSTSASIKRTGFGWRVSGIDHVTRFPASDPSKVENFKTGIDNSGLGIDSQGNVWVTNRFGTGLVGMAHMIDLGMHLKFKGVIRLLII